MALRSLVVKLKALPRRMPGSGAFVPIPKLQDNPLSKRLGSVEEGAVAKRWPQLDQEMKVYREQHQKYIRNYTRETVLIVIAGICFGGHLKSKLEVSYSP